MSRTPTSRRRWVQFSLGTMLLLVTVFAVVLGWEQHHVQTRKLALTAIESARGRAFVYDPEYPLPPEVRPTIPIWRVWFGDQVIEEIALAEGSKPEEERRLKALFPEANVLIMDNSQFTPPGSAGWAAACRQRRPSLKDTRVPTNQISNTVS